MATTIRRRNLLLAGYGSGLANLIQFSFPISWNVAVAAA